MKTTMYSVTKTDINTENYELKLNGQSIDVDTARVSACPFNRAWPGHQRQIEQTELVNFVNFGCEGENILEVKCKEKFDNSNHLDFAPEIIGLEIDFSPAYTSMSKEKRGRGKIRNFVYNNIRLYSWQKPFLFFKGFDKEHQCENIVIQNFFWNDKKLDKLTDFKLEINEFQKNINIK